MQSSTRPSKPKGLNWPVSSHVTVLVRNLRLLHLDHREDWPDITVRSFANSQPNSRQRIKAVEWSLYHLFMLWDPEGTQNKLRPFFPPLEPLQSVNLRSALFRALSDLKKNGVLGREAILRKTMLDDCKGEKFEEVLAMFSMAVLRKVMLARKGEHHNPVVDMALNGASTAEQEMLVPLIIAHRVSLTTMVSDKSNVRESYDRLKKLLQDKADELAIRSKEVADKPTADGDSVSHNIVNLWHGNGKWADTVMNGGTQASNDHLLESPFSKTWSLVKSGRLDDSGSRSSSDLLTDLENRLAEQKARVEKWRKFRQNLGEERRAAQPSKRQDSSQTLTFRNHQSLNIATLAQSDRKSTNNPALHDKEYSSLVSALDAALLKHEVNISQKKGQRDSTGTRKPSLQSLNSNHDSPMGQMAPSSLGDQPTPNSGYMDNMSILSPLPPHGSPRSSPRPESGEISVSRTASYDYFSGRATPSITIEDDPDPDTQNNDLKASERISVNPTRATSGTLVERTRQSMSFLPAPNPRPRQLLAAARSRKSQSFPVNQFETPKKSGNDPDNRERSRAVTPKEELFSQEADYASVFKSRPKVAMSPVNSPSVHISPMDESDMDLDATVEMDDDDVAMTESELRRSPLFGARFTSRA